MSLAAKGFDPGPGDGLIGAKTRAALRQWQASRGDDETGYLDADAAKLLLASGRQHKEQEAARQAAAQAERMRREAEARQRAQREARDRARREAAEAERRRESEVLATLQEAIVSFAPQNGRLDHTRARRLFEQVAQSGHPLAVMWLAINYLEGLSGFGKDVERAQKLARGVIQEIRSLARNRDLEASFLLASAYFLELGVAKDERLAVSWYRKAADQGHVFAQHSLVLCTKKSWCGTRLPEGPQVVPQGR